MTTLTPSYRIGASTVLQRGDRFRATGGPYHTSKNDTGQRRRIRLHEPGPFTFLALAIRGNRQWIEALNRHGQFCALNVGNAYRRKSMPGLVGRPYRILGRFYAGTGHKKRRP